MGWKELVTRRAKARDDLGKAMNKHGGRSPQAAKALAKAQRAQRAVAKAEAKRKQKGQ